MKIKNENETMGFSGTILSIDYKKIDSQKVDELPKYYSRIELESFTDCNGENVEKDIYLANLKVNENKCGRKGRKHKFNMTLYIDEETYDTESLHEGDILQFHKVKMNTDTFSMRVYDTEKLKDYPKAKLKKDENGRTYANIKFTSVKLSCPLNEWKVKCRFEEMYYMTINRVKFFQTCKADMTNNSKWQAFISKSEYNKLLAFNNEVVEVGCYAKKVKFSTFQAKLKVEHETKIDKYYCEFIKVVGNGN